MENTKSLFYIFLGVFAYFCFPCYLCSLAGRLNESCCVPLFLQGGLMAMRTKFRTMYGISVSIIDSVSNLRTIYYVKTVIC